MNNKDFEGLVILRAKNEAYKLILNDLLDLEKKIPIYEAVKDLIKKYKGLIKR